MTEQRFTLASHCLPGTLKPARCSFCTPAEQFALRNAIDTHTKVMRASKFLSMKFTHVYAAESDQNLVRRGFSRAAPKEAFSLHWLCIAQLMCDVVTVIFLAVYLHLWFCQLL